MKLMIAILLLVTRVLGDVPEDYFVPIPGEIIKSVSVGKFGDIVFLIERADSFDGLLSVFHVQQDQSYQLAVRHSIHLPESKSALKKHIRQNPYVRINEFTYLSFDFYLQKFKLLTFDPDTGQVQAIHLKTGQLLGKEAAHRFKLPRSCKLLKN